MLARVIVAIVLLHLPTAGFAQAEKRVALVIGNSAYQHTPKLTNPSNDAADMAAALKRHGFKVIEGVDLDKPGFDRKVRDFATALKGSEVGLFFYAGHGLQVAGQNYLVPVDGKAESADALEFEMIRVDTIHRIMERQTNTNILFLDACRDNPLVRNLARSMGTRSSEVGHGLAPIESGVGTLISFSTQPGNVALDGTGRNSPFAGALAKHLSNANDDLGAILIAVRNDVMRETQRKQVPWEHSALTGRFYFGVPRAAPDQAAELAAWNAVKDTGDPGTIRTYLDRYPQGTYAVVALNLIAALEKQRQTETELETHRQGLAKTREDMRKAQEAALKTVPNKPAPAAPGTYDGTWKVTGVGDARCNIRNWSGSIDIDGTRIISRSTKQGRLTSNGNFTFYIKAQNGDDGLYEGRIEGDVGKGTYLYKSNSCAGTVVLKKMTVAGEGGAQVTLAQPPVCGSSATAIPGKCIPMGINQGQLRALMVEQDLKLPARITISAPSPEVGPELVNYLGAWGGPQRWNGVGRQIVLVVTKIEPGGKASGAYGDGPPTNHTVSRNPAKYIDFEGTIGVTGLEFIYGGYHHTYKIAPTGEMQGTLAGPGISGESKITIERIK